MTRGTFEQREGSTDEIKYHKQRTGLDYEVYPGREVGGLSALRFLSRLGVERKIEW